MIHAVTTGHPLGLQCYAFVFTTSYVIINRVNSLFWKFLDIIMVCVYNVGITEEMLEEENDRIVSDISSKTRTLKQVGLLFVCTCMHIG